MKTNLLTFLILLSLFLFKCASDDDGVMIVNCPEPIFIGECFFEQNNIENPPYADPNEILIFSDSLGNEYKGTLTIGEIEHRMSYAIIENCQSDPDGIYWRYSYLSDFRTINLEFSDLDIGMEFRNYISAFPSDESNPTGGKTETNNLLIDLAPISTVLPFNRIVTEVNDLYDPDAVFYDGTIYHENLELHEKPFEHVYCFKNSIANEDEFDFEFFYNTEIGLVGFKNKTNSTFLKYERSE